MTVKPTVVIAMLASEKFRSLKSDRGSSGSPVLNFCHRTKTTSTAMPLMIRPQTVMGPAMVPQS